MKRPIRIVCYAINGAGMGHVTRLLGVARWMRRLITFLEGVQPEVLFLTSSDASDMLADARFAAFKIPSKTVARAAALEKLEYRRLAKHFIWQTIGVFSPDLLVVDTFPSGSFDELFQILDGPFKKAFLHRNVKDDYASRPTFRAALGFYDAVVIPHRAPPNFVTENHSPGRAKELPTFTGEVVQFDREQMIERGIVRRELGVADKIRLVYISAGGGGDPTAEHALRNILESLRKIEGIHILVGAGPLYRGNRFSGPSITWCESSSVWRYFSGCDAAVSAGGYNTFHELLFAGVPSLFFAQEKIADDQWLRVISAEKQGACISIESLEDDVGLLRSIQRLLEPEFASQLRDSCRIYMAENGAVNCAVELIKPLFQTSRLELAAKVLKPSIVHSLESIAGGDMELIAHWLTAIYPQARLQRLSEWSGLESIVHHLSDAAANELRTAIQRSQEAIGVGALETAILNVLEVVRHGRTETEAKNVGDELFRCFSAVTKKYSNLTGTNSADWIRWSHSLIQSLQRVLVLETQWPAVEMLTLYRVFPRIEDATSAEELSDTIVDQLLIRMRDGEQPHDVLRRFQVSKMTQPAVANTSFEKSEESMR